MRLREMRVAVCLGVGLLLAGCGSVGSGPSGSSEGSATDAAGLIRARCTRCHAIDRIKNARHDAAGWEQTIGRMRGRGVDLSDAQAAALVEFLAHGGGSKL